MSAPPGQGKHQAIARMVFITAESGNFDADRLGTALMLNVSLYTETLPAPNTATRLHLEC